MGATYVTVELAPDVTSTSRFRDEFLVDAGATDSMAPGSGLRQAGIQPLGQITHELADGQKRAFDYGVAVIRFMGETTAGRVIFGEDGVEPLLGVTALESVGIRIDPRTQTLKRLPAIPLK